MSVYLPNNYRLAWGCDSVVDRDACKCLAQDWANETGSEVYVPDLGVFAPASEAPPEVYLTPITSSVNGQTIDPDKQTMEGWTGNEFVLQVESNASIPLTYNWSVRSGQARLSGNGNARVALLQSIETELVSIQADIIDPSETAVDTPQSVRFNIMTRAGLRVDADGSWKESNSYVPGTWAHFTAASFGGPDAASAQLSWRSQKQPAGDDRWWNNNWASYTADRDSHSFKVPDNGIIRFQCKAVIDGESVIYTSPTQQVV